MRPITICVTLPVVMATIDDLRKVRISKLEKIKELGFDPYPSKFARTQSADSAKKLLGKNVSVAGRIRAVRGHGGIQFFDLEDASGKIQLAFKKDNLNLTSQKLLELIDVGDFLGAKGEVFKTTAGEITIDVVDFQILTKSLRPLPEKWHGLTDIETRLRQRYLDLLVNPEIREVFKKKEIFWQTIRNYLKKQGFCEVETPVLEMIPGGADARPFITHMNALDIDLCLRISLELHLKRILVGGFEKVFEIGRIFRNEGIDAEHLQDYTQMEFYWAYADWEDLMDFIEDFYRETVKQTLGTLTHERKGQQIDWSKNWQRVDYAEIFKKKTDIDFFKATKEELYQKAGELKLEPEKNLSKGRLADLIYKKLVRPEIIQPTFITGLPVEISPLAKRDPVNPQKTQRILVLAGGTELGNGFSELNDPLDQAERFLKQQKLREAGDEEAQMYDQDFVEALEYGMPPTAGFGLSERLFAFLMDKPIRETVIFPLMKPEGEK